ncbi:iron-sulfur cluster repair di-iron protein [Chryseobacterium phosphatilyticum]|uniref:Iron-sulfur cluster repair di-iron protein n=1 Tax=Chryseobacterium phosphatilyticum TaxID=475075 RepID=A0A316X6P6_9FLAO|nr:iron-sulfur cluster repair di-iron protein [Chryseobacterium phosphatilyticum]PWN69462.1 iron-sulfur cluster repair di-iron protein [Chryseobacterium phosphatilyticum]
MNTKKDFIGNMVAEDFRTAAIFKRHGIDFCCKGGRTIEEACNNKKLDPEKIYEELEALPKNEGSSIDFNSWPLDLLTDYIEKTHHRYVEEKAPVIKVFLDKLCKVHGGRHPELFEINTLFNQSAHDLSAHMKKEELILFPFVKKMVTAKISGQPLPYPVFNTVENPVHMMEHEHTVEGDRFRKMAEITNEYLPPADACNTYKVAFAMLQDFENDLHKHIHLENNILFPKAIRLEKEFAVKS